MRKPLQLLSCLAILAAPLLALPAHAAGKSDNGAWRAQHEDMESIRVEREQLESDSDRLKMQCMDAKGQDRSSCEEQAKMIHARKDALHQRMEGLHDKREFQRDQRHDQKKKWKEHKKGHKDDWKKRHDNAHHASHGSSHAAPAQDSGDMAPAQ